MRSKKQILTDYLILINKENNLNYSAEDIKIRMDNPIVVKDMEKRLDKELYATEVYRGQKISTERAFYIFCKIVMYKDLKTSRFIWNDFVKLQFNLWEKNKQICYMAHRGSGKTFFLKLYALNKMFLLPYYDVCYSSNVPRQRRRFLKGAEAMIDNNELLLDKKDTKRTSNREIPWGQEEMEYNHGTMEGTTVGTTPRGGHYNLVIGDDPLREDQKYSYEYIVNYFEGTLKPTTYTKKARYGIVGTPQSDVDLFHTLMNNKRDKNGNPVGKVVTGKISAAGFYSEIYPAILDHKTKKVLIPEIWTYEKLMEESKNVGDIRFNREMMCRCTTYKNSLVGAALFRKCSDGNLRCLQKGEEGKKYVIFVDSATSDSPTADYVSMAVFEDNPDGPKFILRNLIHKKGQAITDPSGGDDDQTHDLYGLYKDFNKALIAIEKNNAGIALIQSIQALTAKRDGSPVDVIEHYTGGKSEGIEGKSNDVIDYIEKGLKAGVVVFPADHEDNYTMDILQKVRDEHLNFGVKHVKNVEKYEALAGHDDIFDSCWGAFKHSGDNVDTLPMGITMSGGM